jgi:hypothetical protein
MSANNTCPAAAAAVHNPRIVGTECRTPRRSRGSAMPAKHSHSPPSPAAASTAARSIRTSVVGVVPGVVPVAATGATDQAGMTDCTRNGAADRIKDLQEVPCPTAAPLPICRGHALRDHPVIITNGHRRSHLTSGACPPSSSASRGMQLLSVATGAAGPPLRSLDDHPTRPAANQSGTTMTSTNDFARRPGLA